ncbi:probable LRR receptor-like serine/threonine-protein kinase At1g56140 isoform X2 [Magnolia sinica]|uniref:probable LRR receptor-like serine/threonine-protein kinase At1g56140 isoform X2 n=1 Tax=Magnolia sinica TaxID=86752 RepID=UPI002658D09E|nr:probable LRR receptor-like serine/threonine-protein kinase At1g56140 isoform X2 [Magnolia sinica]
MKSIPKSPSYILLLICFGWIHLFYLIETSTAQTATTDPSEVAALNSIFRQWGLSALPTWNISGEPCSGVAIDDSKIIDDQDMNPAIKCLCTFDNGATCHITALRVYALDVRGPIPEALGSLTRLTNLNLGQNYLTGPLPSFIGNLTSMEYMTFGINALSGSIPKELGNLRSLKSFYMNNAGISSPIPSTFARLVNLQTVRLSDNEFNGSIPDFIGNWTKLRSLRIQGNAFKGPIPSSFSNLTSLTDLRISEITNGIPSLAFVKNMKNLTILVLRNNRISDTIPSDIGEYQSLQHLDLSFNNLTGEIPSSLFSLTSLSYLFLGNNSLSGSLPSNKSPSLVNIDLSYNQLSGSFPSWITQGLQLNLVANNFVIDSSNNSALPSGLNCLQRNFPCNRDSPIYSQFAIKCGGRGMTSSDGTVYENDNEALSAATYYVTDETRWAVSNTGLFAENRNASYISSSSSQFLNTLDSELFQTARISPGSLRYYGLGLENGQYTITLQFAEIAIEDTNTWRSVGRRVFNIYAQGNLQLKDFDIKREAGGAFKRAVVRAFQANVTENFLEIHLFWAGKGTCCIPFRGTYGPSISAISVTPDFTPTVSNRPPGSGKKNKTGLVVGIIAGVGALSFILILAVFIRRLKRRGIDEDEEFLSMAAKANTFSYSELRTATDDFSPANKLGEGGFGPVFKGTLTDGRVIAVKQLSVASRQGRSQFVTEIATISAVQHRNLVKLYGCCIEGDKRLLVYEYLENKSLDQALFGNSNLNLNWATRFDICLGTARGLAYLHEESRLRIVHRDVKASNILLDADLFPKISDFGLAKLYDDKKTHVSTRVTGTIGYLAPEYAMRGHLTEKADVFGFGVVALEILSGRMNSDTSLDQDKIYLLEWAWNLHEANRPLELMDQTLSEFDKEEALRMIGVALLCTQASPGLRPPMSRVVAMLAGDIEVSSITSRPGYLTDWQFGEISTFMTDDTSREPTGRTTNSQIGTSSNTTFAYESPSPMATQPMLHEIIGEGR